MSGMIESRDPVSVVRESGQHSERLRQRGIPLEAQAARERQRANYPVPDPAGVRGG